MRVIILAMAIAACRGEPRPAPEPAAGSGPTPPAADAAATTDAAPAIDAPPSADDLKRHMREHFAMISELQRAIARGHLPEAQQLAGSLRAHDEPLQEGWEPFVTELKASAKAVEEARDLPTAASLAGRLGRACSKCHEARQAIVTFAWQPAPDDGPALAVQMKRHQWAAARLWDGLVGPADALWIEGATVLAELHLDTAQATNGLARGDVPALAAKVRDLSRRAVKLADHDERARLYGELLSTCAGCHQLVRPAPVP